MEWIADNLWAPLVPVALWLWRMLHNHDKELEALKGHQKQIDESIKEGSTGRKQIYDKIESVRQELTGQHALLRKDQREDFKEIRDLIANNGK